MIERAVLQEIVVARDGSLQQQAALRPDTVRAMAKRVAAWRDRPEPCMVCAQPALGLRGGRALCGGCRDEAAVLDDVRQVVRAEIEERTSFQTAGLVGYAIVFDSVSEDLGGFKERIKPSAVLRTLKGGDDVRALWNHDTGIILGRTTSGTLVMRADKTGLRVAIDPPKWAAGYVESVERRDVGGMSFGFRVYEDEWTLEGDTPMRDVVDMAFSEVTATPFPAYKATTLTVNAPQSRVEFLQKWHKTRAAR